MLYLFFIDGLTLPDLSKKKNKQLHISGVVWFNQNQSSSFNRHRPCLLGKIKPSRLTEPASQSARPVALVNCDSIQVFAASTRRAADSDFFLSESLFYCCTKSNTYTVFFLIEIQVVLYYLGEKFLTSSMMNMHVAGETHSLA